MKLSTVLIISKECQASLDGKTWFPTRPLTSENCTVKGRIKASWRVLTGKSDAIEWDEMEAAQIREKQK